MVKAETYQGLRIPLSPLQSSTKHTYDNIQNITNTLPNFFDKNDYIDVSEYKVVQVKHKMG